MTLSVDYIYNYVLDLLNKNQAGGLGNEKFERLWNGEQSAYMDDLLGKWQLRNNGKTGLNTGLIQDETILQKLAPFTKPVTLTIMAANADKPSDFVYRLALRINGKDCYKINHGQIATVNDSVIDAPSTATDTYYFTEYQGYYYFLPRTLPTVSITTAALDYIYTPTNIKWGFTYATNGQQIYDVGSSIQPLWLTNDCREITKRVLKSMGLTFKDKDFENFGNSVIQTGD